ncbi:hypothetical protein HBI88_144600 [Parastagonospora nodorum]|nr:hypothetical protein HBI10_172290 [Parastagonospora nodorum]KAH4016178.1 hypothetical protein HBI13_154470 [Parastagonospora nodorum]KAH4063006.1 hypothetical protein HBH50_198300 [Parastagonospora nodorum]KAH4083440.1 hypothetical protein HBH48_175200 [Parastagonospora nodorum]KAH5770068.1 hypothetical protein HBI97_158270 [Parastagonospora nodorum]
MSPLATTPSSCAIRRAPSHSDIGGGRYSSEKELLANNRNCNCPKRHLRHARGDRLGFRTGFYDYRLRASTRETVKMTGKGDDPVRHGTGDHHSADCLHEVKFRPSILPV